MRKINKRTGLTPQQELFCQYFIHTGIASEAYRMAYDTRKMQNQTIWSRASELCSNGKVAARIEELQKIESDAHRVDRERVEKVLMNIVDVDPADLYFVDKVTGKLTLKSPHQMPLYLRRALKKITNKRGEVSYEFNGKTEAARLLASMNGWEKPKEVKLTGGENAIKTELRIGYDDNDKDVKFYHNFSR